MPLSDNNKNNRQGENSKRERIFLSSPDQQKNQHHPENKKRRQHCNNNDNKELYTKVAPPPPVVPSRGAEVQTITTTTVPSKPSLRINNPYIKNPYTRKLVPPVHTMATATTTAVTLSSSSSSAAAAATPTADVYTTPIKGTSTTNATHSSALPAVTPAGAQTATTTTMTPSSIVLANKSSPPAVSLPSITNPYSRPREVAPTIGSIPSPLTASPFVARENTTKATTTRVPVEVTPGRDQQPYRVQTMTHPSTTIVAKPICPPTVKSSNASNIKNPYARIQPTPASIAVAAVATPSPHETHLVQQNSSSSTCKVQYASSQPSFPFVSPGSEADTTATLPKSTPIVINNPYATIKKKPPVSASRWSTITRNPYHTAKRKQEEDLAKENDDGNNENIPKYVNFKIVGRHYRPNVIFQSKQILLQRDPNNEYDPKHAICVRDKTSGEIGGFVAKDLAKKIAPRFDSITSTTNRTSMLTIEGEITGPDTGFTTPARFKWPE